MDEDARELVERLCTEAGTIMEDVSVVAILRSSRNADLGLRITQVIQAGEDIAALGRTAAIVARQAAVMG